ncbi:hypothetical protein Cmtc_12440 [Cupriavidus sp. TKC]|uniref:hypothetical protein n=1 Tax=Cupriavidus TaxID=106589 RepID=UPI0002A3603D|nr:MULTISPECIES: hypothetical protein [Cupriavidus]EKZ99394.1 hypothetical protein D769_10456 [Cupriavidus sp. HMR-1]GMG90024.1 hypothetical protein Cmtc_12440 [Cupriavidus sp. TKC]
MGKTKKPRKAYRSRAAGPQGAVRLQPWRLDAAFGPLESVLDQIETGVALELSEEGELMYHAAGRDMQYHLVDSIRGFAEAFDIARMRAADCPSTQAVHRFVDKVDRGEALTLEDIQACRQEVMALRHYTGQLSSAALASIVRTVLLKFLMDELSDASPTATGAGQGKQTPPAGAEIVG